MSNALSTWVTDHAKHILIEEIVKYLETVDLSGAAKKQIATEILQLVHIGEGSQWNEEAVAVVSFAIEWVLAEVRSYAQQYATQTGIGTPPPVVAPPATTIYGNWVHTPIPDDEALKTNGFATGDTVWGNADADPTMYVVVRGNGLPGNAPRDRQAVFVRRIA